MADEPDNNQEETRGWEIAKLNRARADYSADLMRTLLFSASTGAIGFILLQQSDKLLSWHVVPLLFFVAAAGLVFFGRDVQKRKASRRLKNWRTPEDEPIGEGFMWKFWEPEWRHHNINIDRFAGMFIALGVVLEGIFRFARV